ncbi:YkvA family protein [Desulfofustis glycolicus]|uniref:Uncharacterized membrane protein YkvA, DUF1232 family n=1 Tax=Desulfofustis glycolicus DSM 9705 TaxID=1121409 RepID=A0A1M5UIN6_9BACT|nr:YkvA family protein [Desulfofustis glycolicus]MCB2217463.1 DUF1232 domain-containing protein [Desulfobulbaceae bacterium]SHH62849.1 Uncharacterized membrane protein YkvA, DUF1232 family [Desulfofustis glycolicus DSM 9705]
MATPREQGFGQRLKRFFRPIVGYVKVLFDPATPWRIRMILAAGVLYLLSPYDLLPDWFLGLGIIDDLAVVSLLGLLAGRMTESDKRNGAE